jgi:hypothetical protein
LIDLVFKIIHEKDFEIFRAKPIYTLPPPKEVVLTVIINEWSPYITLCALSASPLMMGGDLPTLDDFSLKLITDKEMLVCNQNGVMGSLMFDKEGIEIWETPNKNGKGAWIGVFNRNKQVKSVSLNPENFGADFDKSANFFDVCNNKKISGLNFQFNPNGVVFLKY